MTLIITELSKFGIVMVADSAVTLTEILPNGNQFSHVLNGAQKLQAIPYLKAGISVWGLGNIPTQNGNLSTDVWINDFTERHSQIVTLSEFADCLVQELQESVGDYQSPVGFHLAGFVNIENQNLPTFYHVRNVDGTFAHYDFHEFIVGQDYPPRALAENEMYITRNGDYGTYAVLATAVQRALPIIQNGIGINIPHPSLQGRIAYHSAWIKFVSELYASSGLLRTIGGNISALGIYPDGQIIYYPSS
jgi:hypothetical protein